MAEGDSGGGEKEVIFEEIFRPELDNGMFMVALGLGVAVGAVLVFLYLQQQNIKTNKPTIPSIPQHLMDALEKLPNVTKQDEAETDGDTIAAQDGEYQPYSA